MGGICGDQATEKLRASWSPKSGSKLRRTPYASRASELGRNSRGRRRGAGVQAVFVTESSDGTNTFRIAGSTKRIRHSRSVWSALQLAAAIADALRPTPALSHCTPRTGAYRLHPPRASIPPPSNSRSPSVVRWLCPERLPCLLGSDYINHMEPYLPMSPASFSLKSGINKDAPAKLPHKDWPHAPVHRLSENGIYIVTAGTFQKERIVNTPDRLDLVERMLLSLTRRHCWQLEAWAVMANHYHFVARGAPDSTPMGDFLKEFHSRTAIELNRADAVEGRKVWHNFWDTRLTHQYSYLARLNYVHRNPVRHGLVPVANQYPWCSAAWFERVASPAQIKTIYGFKIDTVNVPDDF
jgi:putative transposase